MLFVTDDLKIRLFHHCPMLGFKSASLKTDHHLTILCSMFFFNVMIAGTSAIGSLASSTMAQLDRRTSPAQRIIQ